MLIAATSAGGRAVAAPAPVEPAAIYAGGGTPSSTGVFFPGTAVYDGTALQGVPHPVERGQDLLLTNVDDDRVSRCHQIQSLQERRNGRPLFVSEILCTPSETALVRTSRLAPGTYGYVCAVHSSMYGLIEVR